MRRRGAILAALAFAAAAQAQWAAYRLNTGEAYYSVAYAAGTSGIGGVVRTSSSFPSTTFAALWTDISQPPLNLAPTNDLSTIYAIDGEYQAGQINGLATVWHGTPGSGVNISPQGRSSTVYAMRGPQLAGSFFDAGDVEHAVLWEGVGGPYVDLHPAGAVNSAANATDGQRQGGYVQATTPEGVAIHATVWHGSAASAESYHPSWGRESKILGMTTGEEVGWVSAAALVQQAAIWHGSAESAVLLADGLSTATATNGEMQVGWAAFPNFGYVHAAAWFGTAASIVDLGALLPAGYTTSVANAVYRSGDTFYIAGYASLGGREQAWVWTYTVPGPGTGVPIALAGLLAFRRHRR